MYCISTINIYVGRQWLRWFCYSCFILIGVIALSESIELIRRLFGNGNSVTYSLFAQYIIYKIPSHIEQFLPLIVFIAALVCIWRIEQSKELTIMRTSGLALWRIGMGLNVIVVGFWIFYTLFISPISAVFSSNFGQVDRQIFTKNQQNDQIILSQDGLWLKEAFDTYNLIINIKNYNKDSGFFENAMVYVLNEDMVIKKHYRTPRLQLKNKTWFLHDTVLQLDDKLLSINNISLPSHLNFKRIYQFQLSADKIPWWKAFQFLNLLKKSGISQYTYITHWNQQLSRVFALMGMVLLSLFLVTFFSRHRSGTIILGIGILLGFVINFSLNLFYVFFKSREYSVFLTSWGPNILFFLFMLLIILNQEHVVGLINKQKNHNTKIKNK